MRGVWQWGLAVGMLGCVGCKGVPVAPTPNQNESRVQRGGGPEVAEDGERRESRGERRRERRREENGGDGYEQGNPGGGYGGQASRRGGSYSGDGSAQADGGSAAGSTGGGYAGGQNGGRRGRSRPADGAAPGTFDFYLLNLSWSPEFCVTHPTSAECGGHPGFVIHGLWPQNTDGTYPEKCSSVPAPGNIGSLAPFMPTPSLAQHEWETHGTCSGATPEVYFGQVLRADREVRIPASFAGLRQEVMLAPDAILGQFQAANPGFPAGSIALSCGNNRLTAVEVCMTKDLRPEACQGVRSCRANAVKVTPPGGGF